MKNDSDSIQADSVSTERTAAEAKRYAHGSDQWAELKKYIICELTRIERERDMAVSYEQPKTVERAVTELEILRHVLTMMRFFADAHNASMQEGTSPTS
jgi:hypothetical protein